jgi:hypothetical protein
LHGQAEDRDRAGESARRPLGEGGLREHAISETFYYGWRETLLEGGCEALAGKDERLGGNCAAGLPSWSGRSQEDVRDGARGKTLAECE